MAKYSDMTIGVLALQGDFERHAHRLSQVGARPVEVRAAGQLDDLHGLIVPGGESTTMDILLDRFGLRAPLGQFGSIRPVWGTCAGMVLLAQRVEDNTADIRPLGLIDIDVVRNGYGRQVFSFEETVTATLGERQVSLAASFIRAPRVTRVGPGVSRLASYDGGPVLVSQGSILASSFHTELGDDSSLLEHFLTEFCLV